MKSSKLAMPSDQLRFPYFIYGAIFLFNPFVNIIDVLPDFIGALFFITGLYKLRDMSDYFEKARLGFRRYFWISASRIPAFLVMFNIFHNFSAERSIMLVFTFCYAVIEAVLLVFTFSDLFNGFIYIGERYEGTAMFGIKKTVKVNGRYEFAAEQKYNKDEKSARKNRMPPLSVSGLRTFTLVSVLLIRCLSVLPELVYTSTGDVLSADAVMSPVHFKGFFTVLAIVPAFVVGIIWLVNFIRYMRGFCADTTFCSSVLNAYNEKYKPTDKLFVYRKFSVFCVFLAAASILSLDFFLDEVNAFPDVLAASLLFCGVLYFSRKIEKLPFYVKSLSFAAMALDAFSYYLADLFKKDFYFSDVWRIDDATNLYLVQFSCDTAATVLMLCVAVCVIKFVSDFVSCELSSGSFSSVKKARSDVVGVRSSAIKCSIFVVLSAISNIIYRLVLVDTESVAITDQRFTDSTHIYIPRMEMYWMLDVLLSFIVIGITLVVIEKYKDSLKYKYMIDG